MADGDQLPDEISGKLAFVLDKDKLEKKLYFLSDYEIAGKQLHEILRPDLLSEEFIIITRGTDNKRVEVPVDISNVRINAVVDGPVINTDGSPRIFKFDNGYRCFWKEWQKHLLGDEISNKAKEEQRKKQPETTTSPAVHFALGGKRSRRRRTKRKQTRSRRRYRRRR